MFERHKTFRGGLKLLFSFLAVLGITWVPTLAGATTRVGNSEIQLVYEMQQAMQFKGDPTNNAEWVQWRNEMRLEYQYEDLVEDNKIWLM